MDEKKGAAAAECICKGCPTYADCGEGIAFCFADRKSKCIKKESGCLCGACPVKKKMALKHYYYCTRGPEARQKG